MKSVPINNFVCRIASRCNLNCSYCYMYNSVDKTWQKQPQLMSEKVANQIASRILEYCNKFNVRHIYITLHGGEPMLGGESHLEMITSTFRNIFVESGIDLTIDMQSNGLLFTDKIGEVLLNRRVYLGISLDGPPHINDMYRVDHSGGPSTHAVTEKLKLITSTKYSKIFSGFLAVINVRSNPIEVLEYLMSFNPPAIDFLFPHFNYDFRPVGKEMDINLSIYADWLISVFEHWYKKTTGTRIRIFEHIILGLLGQTGLIAGYGTNSSGVLAIETDGSLEGMGSLKTTFIGAPYTGYNVFDHTLEIIANHPMITFRDDGPYSLCGECRQCELLSICGGGYLPHRYSRERGFNNPSIYCSDLMKLIYHIRDVIKNDTEGIKAAIQKR